MHTPQRYLFERDWTTCSRYVYHSKLNNQHSWRPVCGFLMAHCQSILITRNNLRLAPKPYAIHPGFFEYICRRNENFKSQIWVVLGSKQQIQLLRKLHIMKLTAATTSAVKAAAMMTLSGDTRAHSRCIACTKVMSYCFWVFFSATCHQLPYGRKVRNVFHICITCDAKV